MRTISRDRKPSVPSGSYTWNADSTLASYPGPGYTRKLSYDEEGRLTKISRDNGTTITPVFEYGYGFDGNRRWRKDLAGNTWDWYPCGVACCSGELVTMRSTNGGVSWSVAEAFMGLGTATLRDGQPLVSDIQGALGLVTQPTARDFYGQDRVNGLNPGRTSEVRNIVDESMLLTSTGGVLFALGESGSTMSTSAAAVAAVPFVIGFVCALACAVGGVLLFGAWKLCESKGDCSKLKGFAYFACMLNCAFKELSGVGIAAGIGCLLCICAIPQATPFCAAFAKVLKGIKPLPKVTLI